jgi:nucleotidyltransferase/DNA polymerase involved in DNA repair
MIACVSISYFASTVERRDDKALLQTPLVLGGQKWEPRPLFGYSREAALRGVRPGMSLRLAHVLSPHSHFLPAAPPRYENAAAEVIDVLTDFTHLVEPRHLWHPADSSGASFLTIATRSLPAQYYVDLEALPEREATPLLQEMGRLVRQQVKLAPALGLASNRFTAQVAATLTKPSHLRPITPGSEEQFLAQQSIGFLPLDKETARRLHLLGIHTLGQFTALPQSALHEQFGADILPLYRLAQGHAVQSLQPQPQQPAGLQRVRRFEPPLADRLILQAILEKVAAELAGQLQEMQHATAVLTLKAETETGVWQQRRPLRQPAAATVHLVQHLHALLEQLPLNVPLTSLVVSAGELEPQQAQQLSLFSSPASRQVDHLLPAAMTRHKSARFYRPLLDDAVHPLPECRFRLQPL